MCFLFIFFLFYFFIFIFTAVTILSVDIFPLLEPEKFLSPIREVLDPGMVALFNLTFEAGYAKASKASF